MSVSKIVVSLHHERQTNNPLEKLKAMKASLIIKTAKSETRVDNVDFMFDCASCEMNVKGKTIVAEYDQEVADEVRKNKIATVSISNKETNGKVYASVYGTTILIAKLIK